MFRIVALLFALCFAEAIPPALVPDHEATSLLQAAGAREVQHGGGDANDGYGTWSMSKEKRGVITFLNKAKSELLKRIQTETSTAMDQIKTAHTGAMALLKNSSDEAAVAAIQATELMLAVHVDHSVPASADTDLWDLMDSKSKSMKAINRAKKATLESFLKAKYDLLSAIKNAKLSSVHFIWKLAKDEVSQDASDLMDLVTLFDAQKKGAEDLVFRLERDATSLLQAIGAQEEPDETMPPEEPDDEEPPADLAPAPDEPWTVRKARKEVLESVKKLKMNVLESVTKYKNLSLQHIKTAFMDAVHDIRAEIKKRD